MEKIKYDPYGEPTVTLQPEKSASDNPYLFQGRRLDTETGLYYYRNRYYGPVLGRFVQRDPAGYGDGMNLYEFVRSNPAVNSDPEGLKHWSCCWKFESTAESMGLTIRECAKKMAAEAYNVEVVAVEGVVTVGMAYGAYTAWGGVAGWAVSAAAGTTAGHAWAIFLRACMRVHCAKYGAPPTRTVICKRWYWCDTVKYTCQGPAYVTIMKFGQTFADRPPWIQEKTVCEW
ncbi:MAG: RHS repeat-associated core domain-containing protein [Planctomycetes bacterium]|nr:RHS repeat-associated core domain-containing protein [Planctomycetota bacterium]